MATTEQIRTQVKKQLDDVTTSAHQVFLAGLGAAAIAQEEQAKLFDRLVARGRKVEAEGKKKVGQGRKQVTEVRKRAGQALERLQGEVDNRLAKAVNRLGIPNQQQIRQLSDRVAELTRKVEGLQKVTVKTAAAS